MLLSVSKLLLATALTMLIVLGIFKGLEQLRREGGEKLKEEEEEKLIDKKQVFPLNQLGSSFGRTTGEKDGSELATNSRLAMLSSSPASSASSSSSSSSSSSFLAGKRTRHFVDSKHHVQAAGGSSGQDIYYNNNSSASNFSSASESSQQQKQQVLERRRKSRPSKRRKEPQRQLVASSTLLTSNTQQIDIQLERDNFILHNRCSMNKLYLQLDWRSKSVEIGSRQQKSSSSKLNQHHHHQHQHRRLNIDAARIKLLSMIITVESVPARKREEATGSGLAITGLALNNSISSRQQQAVKLRSNLTELYICFDGSGNLEAKVNGSGPSCLFNELTLDRHVKYQSAYNTSWYIGFDHSGNPLPASSRNNKCPEGCDFSSDSGDEIQSPEQQRANTSERCFLFTKLKKLTTSTQLFPEALELIEAQRRQASSSSSSSNHLLLLSSSPSASLSSNRTNQSSATEHEIKTYQSAEMASLAKKRGSSTTNFVVHSFHQRQLINMSRYRNILRYQMNRSAGQSLLPDNDETLDKSKKFISPVASPSSSGNRSSLFESRAQAIAV